MPAGYKKKYEKKIIFVLKVTEERSRIGIRCQTESGSISQRYRSADPDPHQNVTGSLPTLTKTVSLRTEKKFKRNRHTLLGAQIIFVFVRQGDNVGEKRFAYKLKRTEGCVPGGNCRVMPRNFFSSSRFQRKSLVFFQSINFLCRKLTWIYFPNPTSVYNASSLL